MGISLNRKLGYVGPIQIFTKRLYRLTFQLPSKDFVKVHTSYEVKHVPSGELT